MTANPHPLDEPDRLTPTAPVSQQPDTFPTMPPPSAGATADHAGDAMRELALERLKKKAEFRMHLLIYVLVNGMIVLIWAMTGAHFFWPVFPMAGWGIGLVAHGVDTYARTTPTEDEINAEIERLRRR